MPAPDFDYSQEDINQVASIILKQGTPEGIQSLVNNNRYTQYQDDPVGFCEDVLRETLTDDVKKMLESVRDNTVTVAISANGTGKSQPLGTKVMTPGGEVRIGDISPGDYVIGSDGKPCKVRAIYFQGRQPTYEIFFNDDTSVCASEDHLWSARSSSNQNRNLPYKIYTTEQLSKILHRTMYIPVCKAIKYKKQILDIDSYVMGVLLGDGHLGDKNCVITLTSNDQWMFDEMRSRVHGVNVKSYKSTGHTPRVGFTTPLGQNNPFRDAIIRYGLLGCKSADKFIPNKYMVSDVEDRKMLLAGLLDTDGYIDTRHSMSYTTVSGKLARQVQYLVWSLGGTAKIREKNPFYAKEGNKIYGKKAYNLYIKLPFCPFRMPRKVGRYVPEENLQKQAQRVIKKIKYIGMIESVCIEVDNTDGLYLTENFIVTHNTHGAARAAVWFYLCFQDTKVFTAAAPPYDNLKNLLWGEIGGIIQSHPELFRGDEITSLDVRRGPEEYMIGVTIPSSGTEQEKEAKFSGKHQKHMLFAFDEGDAIPSPVYQGTESCMSGGHVRLLIMFNPRHASGPVYRMVRDKTANVVHLSAFDHPNVVSGKDIIPGAVDRKTTVRRVNEWTRPLRPGDKVSERSVYALPDFLVGVVGYSHAGKPYPPLKAGQYKIINSAFAYMVLGQYPAQASDQLISEEWYSAARARYDIYTAQYGEAPPVGAKGIMGLDVAEMGDDSNVAVGRYGGYLTPLDCWDGIDTVETGDKAIDWYKTHPGINRANVDANGYGAGVAPHMQKFGDGVVATGIKVTWKPTISSDLGDFRILRDELLWRTREWLRCDPGAMLPPDSELEEELMAPTFTTDSGYVEVMQTKKIKELIGRSPDKLMALALTFAGAGGFFDACDFRDFPE